MTKLETTAAEPRPPEHSSARSPEKTLETAPNLKQSAALKRSAEALCRSAANTAGTSLASLHVRGKQPCRHVAANEVQSPGRIPQSQRLPQGDGCYLHTGIDRPAVT